VQLLEERVTREATFENIVGRSDAIRDVFDQIQRVAETDATVLITGESGTGKELVAEAIHFASARRDGPYIAVNMAAVPETLVESELFGHVKGAFTGAGTDRAGRFEAANGGTIFVDEIGDLELTSQAKLLRVLEDHQITPIGTNESRRVDVRVIAATSRQLETMVADSKFREDLYYRLNVVAISLPPLRKRREDILLLTQHFLDEACRINGRPPCHPNSELLRFLETYDWPGNVRQLRNCIESMVVLARSTTLSVDDLPAMVRNGKPSSEPHFEIPKGFTLEDVEKIAIRQTLGRYGGNRTQAAQSLGISVRTLQRKLKRWQADNSWDPSSINKRSESRPRAAEMESDGRRFGRM
jgi:DNA-binding NtrC family response regulator